MVYSFIAIYDYYGFILFIVIVSSPSIAVVVVDERRE
jgi:hypothetical protein